MSGFSADAALRPQSYTVNPDHEVTFDGETIVIRTTGAHFVLKEPALWPFISEALKTGEPLTSDPRALGDVSDRDLDRMSKAFALLEDVGILVPEKDEFPSTVISMFNRGGGMVERAEILRRLESASICIAGDESSFLVQEILRFFSYYPIRQPTIRLDLPSSDYGHDLVLVAANDLLGPTLDVANKHLWDSKSRVWAPLTPAMGSSFTVGPWYYPGRSACHACFRLRRGSSEREPTSAEHFAKGVSAVNRRDRSASKPALTSMQAAMVADAAINHVGLDGAAGQLKPAGYTRVSQGIDGFTIEEHSILRVPRCPSCSPAADTGFPQIWFHEESS